MDISRTTGAGQRSPFRNFEVEEDPENILWDHGYVVTNITTGRRFTFEPPNIQWARIGFYEGREAGVYYVDPQLVIDTVTKTDRVYQTREELEAELLSFYLLQGWKYVGVGKPENFTPDFILGIKKELYLYNDSITDNSIIQLASDDNFTMIRITEYGGILLANVDIALGILSAQNELLTQVSVEPMYIVNRTSENADDTTVHIAWKSNDMEDGIATIILSSKRNKDGWTLVEKRSASSYPDFVGYQLKVFNYSSFRSELDVVEKYANTTMEIMLQRLVGIPFILYLINKVTGRKQVIELANKEGPSKEFFNSESNGIIDIVSITCIDDAHIQVTMNNEGKITEKIVPV